MNPEKKLEKKFLSFMLALAMVITMVPMFGVEAWAAGTTTDVKYIDADGQEKYTTVSVTVIDSLDSTSAAVTWTAGWYVVSGTGIELTGGAIVSGGAVNLILADGCSITVSAIAERDVTGLSVSDGASLTIYEGSTSGNLTGGTLNIYGYSSSAAAIGIDLTSGSSITINGGAVNIRGNADGSNSTGYGIQCGANSNITINGGTVDAISISTNSGIGISGDNDSKITINGGTVTATGSGNNFGYGIFGLNNSHITLNDGKVTAKGGNFGILGFNGANIEINGGTTTARGGVCGIGAALASISVTNNLMINAGTDATSVYAIDNAALSSGGYKYVKIEPSTPHYRYPVYKNSNPAQGILKWQDSTTNAAVVTSNDGQVIWEAGWYVVYGKVIITGGAIVSGGAVNLILADGCDINITSESGKAGINVTGSNSFNIYAGSISGTVEGTGKLNVTGIDGGAGIGGINKSNSSNITINGGIVTATGGDYAAGIGGGNQSIGSNITINGGTIKATGRWCGAGIGGGNAGRGSDIIVNGGTVTATGGPNGAGIGGGYSSNGINISINGGTVTATGGDYNGQKGNGIGSGYYGTASNNITVKTSLLLKAGISANPTDTVSNSGSDLAASLAGKQYVIITANNNNSGYAGDSSSTVTVPVSKTEEGSTATKVTATVSNGNATVTIQDKDIEHLKENGTTVSGNPTGIQIDLSTLNSNVASITISTETFKEIEKLIESKDTDYNYLEIKLPGSTVMLYEDTVKALADQANGSDVKLVVNQNSKAESTMTSAQKSAMSEMNNPAVYDAYFESNGKRISDFKGGTAAIKGVYPTTKPVRVWYLDEKGNKEAIDSVYDGETVTFVIEHFSHYVIEEINGSDYANCLKDSGCVLSKFSDANTKAWYHDGMHFCVANGYINGTNNGRLMPTSKITRAQICTILWNIAGQPEVDYAMNFSDVKDTDWFAEAVRWAASEGIVKGYTTGAFGPDDAITREQLAQMLYGYAKTKDMGFTGSWMFLIENSDADKISGWASEAMHWVVMKKIISGNEKGLLSPQGTASRAEAATMLKSFCELED